MMLLRCHPERSEGSVPFRTRTDSSSLRLLRMTCGSLVVLFVTACGAAAPSVAPAPASPALSAKPAASASAKPAGSGLTKITVSHPDGGAHLPLWYAKEKGIFAKNGLDVDLQQLGRRAPALAPPQNNQTQFADITGSVISAAN